MHADNTAQKAWQTGKNYFHWRFSNAPATVRLVLPANRNWPGLSLQSSRLPSRPVLDYCRGCQHDRRLHWNEFRLGYWHPQIGARDSGTRLGLERLGLEARTEKQKPLWLCGLDCAQQRGVDNSGMHGKGMESDTLSFSVQKVWKIITLLHIPVLS